MSIQSIQLYTKNYVYIVFPKLLVSESCMKVNDDTLFLVCEFSSLDIRPKIIRPSQSATLATPIQAGKLGKRSPASIAALVDVINKLLILLRSPWSFLQVLIVLRTIWRSHCCKTE